MIRGVAAFDVNRILRRIREKKIAITTEYAKQSYAKGEDTLEDHNNFEYMLLLKYTLVSFKLVLAIFNVSYFLSITWIIICALETEWFGKQSIKVILFDHSFDFLKYTNFFQVVTANIYWSFTTLSTVGFGDMYPKSDLERFLGAAIFLFGVATFSFIMGNFIEILNFLKELNDDLDEGDKLN